MENDRQYLKASELVVGNTYKLIDKHDVIFEGLLDDIAYFQPSNETDIREFSHRVFKGLKCWHFRINSLNSAGKLYLIEDNTKTVEEMVAAIHAMIVKIIR
jgi:hypothetical protein